jgi:hypothetical protein
MNDSLTTSWLGIRLGRDPQSLERLRKAGQILGVRRGGGYAFPAWQFDEQGRVIDGIPQAIAAARSAGVSDDRLAELLEVRVGLASGQRLVDSLRDGNVSHVLGVVRAQAAQAA